MGRRVAIASLLALLASSLLGGSSWPVLPSHAEAQSNVLYRWTFPSSGQVGDWIAHQHVLSYSGESSDARLAPFTLHTSSFAVQVTMRGLGPGGPEAEMTGFGLVVRQSRQNVHSSISAGSFFSSDFENNNPEIVWNGDTVAAAAFDPGTKWHLYRFEVQGDQYTLFIDGRQMVRYTIADYPNPSAVGIFSAYYKVQVKSFAVVALPPAAASAAPFPPTKPYALQLPDLPTDTFFSPTVQHYYTNEEVARERGVPLASIEQSGRIISYGVDYYTRGGNLVDLYSQVTAFHSPQQAQADVPARLASFRTAYAKQPNLHDIPAGLAGDEEGGLGFDFSSQGISFRLLVIYLARGSYTALVRVTVLSAAMTPDQLLQYSLALARIMDGKLQAAQSQMASSSPVGANSTTRLLRLSAT